MSIVCRKTEVIATVVFLIFRANASLIVPAKLDPLLLREPRVNQGIPKITPVNPKRKPTPTNIPAITKQYVDK